MKKISFLILFIFYGIGYLRAQVNPKVGYFDLQDVRLLDSPFKHAGELDKKYLLDLDADRLLAPFLREAGLQPTAPSYTNWENTGLDGHIGGHYLSALALMYASTGDEAVGERLRYMLRELRRCQDANGNGYIGGVPGGKKTWDEIMRGEIKAGAFSLNGKWVPLYNIHKTYAGLRDAWLYAHEEPAKEMLVKMTDWAMELVSGLSDEQMQDILRSEHGGLNEIFADVAAITGEKKYLALAQRFSHRAILEPLLQHEDRLTGMHANTQIPKVIGFERIADIGNNPSWHEAARFFWETVIENRSVCIGGNSANEHFHPANDFSRMIKSIEGPETCNTYNMLRLTGMLYRKSLDTRYIDYYERALYNHILSSQNPHTGGLVYFTQMRPGHYRVYSQPQTSMWCCVGSGIENHARYGEMIYAHTDNELYVNLFIPSRLNWKEKDVEVVQENVFPDEAKTQLTINPGKSVNFTLQLRYPAWVKDGMLKVTVNGKNFPVSETQEGYISISRKWKKGDKVIMEMPMNITAEQLPDKSNYYSILYGPIVLAAKTGTDDLKGLFADDSRGGHIAHGRQIPLKDIPVIVSEPEKITSLVSRSENKPLAFTLSGLYSEKYPGKMELIPFFRLHESRYIIYWPQATESEIATLQQKTAAEEQERIRLDAITVDKVSCGEQQPESDHFVQFENSDTGFSEDEHWREARGWFSYRLKNTGKKARYVYLKYLNLDPNRKFDVMVNDTMLTSLTLDGDKNNPVSGATIPIPEDEAGKQDLVLKIAAHAGSRTGKIVEIRLLD